MRSLDKALIIGEVGINAKDGTCRSRLQRRDAFKQKFDGYLAQDGVAAVLVWNYRPAPEGGEGCDSVVFPGDPLMDLMRTYP